VNHAAIDLGSKESQVCMRAPDGTVVLEKKHPTRRLGELMASWPQSRVVLETSSEAFAIADAARAAGHEVRVVRSTLSRQLGVGERGIKSDLRDARKLSEVSTRIDLASVHIPSAEARALRSRIRSRDILVTTRTALINHVRGWLRTHVMTLTSKGTPSTFPARVRATVVSRELELPSYIEHSLSTIDVLNQQILAATKELAAIAKAHDVCCRLMTVPGVGPITSLAFVAAIDDVSRFSHAHRVSSYLGLTPGEDSSGERERRTGITKAGASSVRRLLIQAAWGAYQRAKHDPMVVWMKRIADRRGKFIAIVALARKLSAILFALWRDQTTYRAARAAQSAPMPS
jgi:transposase